MRRHMIFRSYCHYYSRYYYRMTTVVTTVATQHGIMMSLFFHKRANSFQDDNAEVHAALSRAKE